MLQIRWGDYGIEAGADEAGRGCLAGPVTAAAIILPDQFSNDRLNDSKQLKESDRDYLRKLLEDVATSFHVAHITHTEIDEINILNASIKAMSTCLQQLKPRPDLALIDGNRFKPIEGIPHQCVIKGDRLFQSIAAASILAKTYRDDFMKQLHEEFPQYNWQQNKGYPTLGHRKAIAQFGPSDYHRKSFTLLPPQLKLNIEGC